MDTQALSRHRRTQVVSVEQRHPKDMSVFFGRSEGPMRVWHAAAQRFARELQRAAEAADAALRAVHTLALAFSTLKYVDKKLASGISTYLFIAWSCTRTDVSLRQPAALEAVHILLAKNFRLRSAAP